MSDHSDAQLKECSFDFYLYGRKTVSVVQHVRTKVFFLTTQGKEITFGINVTLLSTTGRSLEFSMWSGLWSVNSFPRVNYFEVVFLCRDKRVKLHPQPSNRAVASNNCSMLPNRTKRDTKSASFPTFELIEKGRGIVTQGGHG